MSPRHHCRPPLVGSPSLNQPLAIAPQTPERRRFMALTLGGWMPLLTACGGHDDEDRPSATPMLMPSPQTLNEPVALTVDAPPGKSVTLQPPQNGQEWVASLPPTGGDTPPPVFAKLAAVHLDGSNQFNTFTIGIDHLALGQWWPFGHLFRRLVHLQRYSPTWVPGNDSHALCGGPPSRVVVDGGVLGFGAPVAGPPSQDANSVWVLTGSFLRQGHIEHPRGESHIEVTALSTDTAMLNIHDIQTTDQRPLKVGESVTVDHLMWQLLRIIPADSDRPAFAEFSPQPESGPRNSTPHRAPADPRSDWPVAC